MNLTPQTPPHPSGDKRFKLLDVAIKRHQFRQDALIEILHTAQELFGYLDNDVLIYVGHAVRAPRAASTVSARTRSSESRRSSTRPLTHMASPPRLASRARSARSRGAS